jgi:DNA replicative helicase MCM subunit Mcm2 (Cdc46/Mcm family)
MIGVVLPDTENHKQKAVKRVKDLKPGDKVMVAGIEMEFQYFTQKNRKECPTFTHEKDGYQIVYVNYNNSKETLLSQLR